MPDQAELPVWRCLRCNNLDSAAFARCPRCASGDVEIQSVAGEGVVASFTWVRRPPPAFRALGEYAVGIVDLAGGLRVPGRLDVDADVLRPRLAVALQRIEDGAPVFVARGEAT